jgi:hypothetical protein
VTVQTVRPSFLDDCLIGETSMGAPIVSVVRRAQRVAHHAFRGACRRTAARGLRHMGEEARQRDHIVREQHSSITITKDQIVFPAAAGRARMPAPIARAGGSSS